MALDDECPLCAAKAVDRQKDREYQIVGDYKLKRDGIKFDILNF
jgi:hypothetical protein